jgi:hypothetical protein
MVGDGKNNMLALERLSLKKIARPRERIAHQPRQI